jgi:hypothetical protein
MLLSLQKINSFIWVYVEEDCLPDIRMQALDPPQICPIEYPALNWKSACQDEYNCNVS